MHSNPAFRKADHDSNLAFARQRGFGTLIGAVDGACLISHVPFVLNDAGTCVEAHLARSNPLLRAIGEGLSATLSVSGPDSYISPDWYGVPDQVPTWNYVAVHLEGMLTTTPQESLRPHLARLSHTFETRLNKPEWTMDKMTPDALSRLERAIVPVLLSVEQVNGTWKLSQNKDPAVRLSAASALDEMSIPGSADQMMATLMADPGH